MAIIVNSHNPISEESNNDKAPYNISGLFLLPQALPFRTSAPNARNDDICLPNLSCGVGGQDKYDRYCHFGDNGNGTGLREQRGIAHHPPTARDHPHPQPIWKDDATSLGGRSGCRMLESPPRRLILLYLNWLARCCALLRYEKLWYLFYRYLRVPPGTTGMSTAQKCNISLSVKIHGFRDPTGIVKYGHVSWEDFLR